jgi:hypothetical protein
VSECDAFQEEILISRNLQTIQSIAFLAAVLHKSDRNAPTKPAAVAADASSATADQALNAAGAAQPSQPPASSPKRAMIVAPASVLQQWKGGMESRYSGCMACSEQRLTAVLLS